MTTTEAVKAGPSTQAGDGGQSPVQPLSIVAQEPGGIRGAWARSFRHGRESGFRFRDWLSNLHPKAFISLWRQRIILTLRYFFRIPIDDIRERDLHNLANSMKNLATQNVQLLQLVNNLADRLAYYEAGPLQESHEEYVNNLEVGILAKQGLIKFPARNGAPQ